MGKTGYIILAILVLVFLVIVFFVTYVLNKKNPVPKGCENLIDEEKCASCTNTSCNLNKLKEDLKEAKEKLDD